MPTLELNELDDTVTEDELRAFAARFCNIVTDGDNARRLNDPKYQIVCEGRDPGPTYSSCADLGHALLEAIGCRETFVNRRSLLNPTLGHPGFRGKPSVNLLIAKGVGTNVFAEAVAASVTERRAMLKTLKPGDICVTWTGNGSNAHVCVFESYDGAQIRTWDMGQGAMPKDLWKKFPNQVEARRKVRSLAYFNLRSVLRLDRVPRTAEMRMPAGFEPPVSSTTIGAFFAPPIEPVALNLGSQGPEVERLQRALNELAELLNLEPLDVDGDLGPLTKTFAEIAQALDVFPEGFRVGWVDA